MSHALIMLMRMFIRFATKLNSSVTQ